MELYEVTLKLVHPQGRYKPQNVSMRFYGAKTAVAYANTMYKRYMYFEKCAMMIEDITIHKLIKRDEVKEKESSPTKEDDSPTTDGDA